MSHLPIPLSVVYAGLAGTVLSLLVATATNKWSPRVFFLLTLRLAIGWHFAFEGLHKIHSISTGPTETNRPFSSEPYFKVAPGPLGEKMRKEFSDPGHEIATKVKASEDIAPAEFKKLSVEDQAAKCPAAVVKLIDAVQKEPEKEKKKADEIEAKETAEAPNDEAKSRAKAKADAARAAAAKKAEMFESEAGKTLFRAAKATYARWVYGVDARECKVKSISGEVPLTGPQRIEHLEWVRRLAKSAEARETDGLGNGYGIDSKRVAEFRMDALTAETELARDANAFIAELKKDLNGGSAVEEPTELSNGQWLDRYTMWFIFLVGVCLMAGLFTRLACVLAAGFLVMTYLAHPAFPWYPLPPNTEGNPVFINKNVIEALALLALACYPTGRWLGLDALVLRPFCKYKGEAPVA
ncbi:DoxX family protein [Frigoriglobus tundricola]|uniref:DoxX family protein n=1 Tax=Frigoriglobus tundricola TaxID=2774151 RepID=A0A6M5YHR9_9BACT|nr:DoxX family protein [Frigoriglobus tundricola]QJW93074.1 hypothetical protein FTUN_0576 [Frigoriglobus tundricola]